jgi:hypothetical protein
MIYSTKWGGGGIHIRIITYNPRNFAGKGCASKSNRGVDDKNAPQISYCIVSKTCSFDAFGGGGCEAGLMD